MLRSMLVAIGLTGMLLAASAAPAQTMFRPVAIVNDSAITGFDLAQRAQILVALGFTTANPDVLRAEALDRLIEDRLKEQEAKRLGLSSAQEDIDSAVAEYANLAGLSENEFRTALSAQGVTGQALNDMATAYVLWSQVVRSRFANRVEPGEADIDAEIALMQSRAGASYRVQEIDLPRTDAGQTDAETQALAERLYDSLSRGGDFDAAVKTYSRSPSAARGGDIGWVSTLQMPPDLADTLSALQPGEVSRPIPVSGGYSILKLVDRRVDQADSPDSASPELREEVRRRLVNVRASRLAEGLLQELRRDALIELR